MKTELAGRNLWYDGTVEVLDDDGLIEALLHNVPLSKLSVISEAIPGIKQFNQRSEEKLGVKSENKPLVFTWQIPREYSELDIDGYVKNLIHPPGLVEKREVRLANEVSEFKRLELLDFLRVIIFIVDTFKKEKVVWGVGRGSSCASYLLFLIGLHLVDPVIYDIPMTEFLREKIVLSGDSINNH